MQQFLNCLPSNLAAAIEEEFDTLCLNMQPEDLAKLAGLLKQIPRPLLQSRIAYRQLGECFFSYVNEIAEMNAERESDYREEDAAANAAASQAAMEAAEEAAFEYCG